MKNIELLHKIPSYHGGKDFGAGLMGYNAALTFI
jgi:hypothetical protein